MEVIGEPATDQTPRPSLAARLIVFVVIAIAILLIWISNVYLTDRFTQATRSSAELRLALYSGNITSELQRNSVVPLLLSRDPVLISALERREFVSTSLRLISYLEEIGSAGLVLLDASGRTVAASDRRQLGTMHRNAPYFVDAIRTAETTFNAVHLEGAGLKFTYSRRMEVGKEIVGVIVVEVDLAKLESRLVGTGEAIMVTNSEGKIILSTESKWKNLSIEEALETIPAPSVIERALKATADWSPPRADAILEGRALLRLDAKIPFQGWRLTYFTTYANVRERVNGVLALEIMGFALLVALVFYILSRRALQQSFLFQRESIELRALNERLSLEISERERVERDLQVAEQSLAQSSKLAALGEMSAAVSHELNQPLAAMKTYLAGAKLLLQRHRPDEAQSSFQRIDDLIERMGAITRQLKSYARKGGDDLMPVDLRDVTATGLSMMEPQLNQMEIRITQTLPKESVMVLGDQVRLEQVVVNLLRNALDAMKTMQDRQLDIMLTITDVAKLSVRDNGTGIDDLESLFEPFYTTKRPGDGVGLGLAISSGIVTDLGGRLIARNAKPRGAVFEMQLPLVEKEVEAAE